MSIAEMSVSGGTMILVTALVRLIAGDRLPRRGYVALWTAAILRLLLPLQIASPVSFYGFLAGTAVPVERLGAIAVGETPAGLPIWTVLWLAGAAVTGIAFAVSYLRCIRAFRTGTPLESQFVDEWLAKNAHGRQVAVRALPGLHTPLTYGLLHPVILLPEEAESWDGERLGMVLCHEFTHIRRWDGALKKLAVVALCLHWCNPAAWLMVALLDRDIELACDGAVVEHFGSNSRGQYARLLIDLRAPQRDSPLVTGFGQNVTERRVLGVMRHRRAGKMAVAVSAVLVVSVIGVFATSAERDPSMGYQLENANNPKDTITVPEQSAKRADDPADSDSPAIDVTVFRLEEASQLSFDALPDALSRSDGKEVIFVPTHSAEKVAYVVTCIPAALQGGAAQ